MGSGKCPAPPPPLPQTWGVMDLSRVFSGGHMMKFNENYKFQSLADQYHLNIANKFLNAQFSFKLGKIRIISHFGLRQG